MRIARFIAVRLANSVVVMALVAVLTFLLIDLAPGSVIDDLQANPQLSSDTLARIRTQYALDQPFYRKFWRWGRSLAKGDLGDSFVYQRPIRQLLGERIANTILLNGCALLLAWLAGLGLGLVAAAARGSFVEWMVDALTAALLSTPVVVTSLVLLVFAARAGLPIGGLSLSARESMTGLSRLLDGARHLLLPMLAVASVWMPAIARHTHAALLETLGTPHALAARARGVGPGRLLLVHALREALNPLTSLVGLSVAGLVSASFVVEVVMAWPGIGALTYDAVIRRDIFLVVDLVQLAALLLLAGNTVGDLLLHAVDPRISAA
jgi:peptide/nickel transport system permease protein